MADNPKKTDNLYIWKKVCETDPKYTKKFKLAGGFEGVSTNSIYLIKKATELWGPIGKGWGYDILEDAMLNGHDILSKEGHPIATTMIHKIKMSVWYIDNGEKIITPPQFGQTLFIGRNKWGVFTDEEAPKKSVTDALSKCFSMLGFSSDVFMGLYDDSKYVSVLQQKYESMNIGIDKEVRDEVNETYFEQTKQNLMSYNDRSLPELADYWKSIQVHVKKLPKEMRDELTVVKENVKSFLQTQAELGEIDDEIIY